MRIPDTPVFKIVSNYVLYLQLPTYIIDANRLVGFFNLQLEKFMKERFPLGGKDNLGEMLGMSK